MYRVIHILYSFLYVCIWTSIRSEWKSTSGQGCFLSLPMHRKPSFLGGTNLLWCFFIEKDLECSTLCQAGIVYKKESIWLINSMLCEIFLENVVRAWGYEWEQVFLPLAYKWFIVSLLCLQWGHEGINAPNFFWMMRQEDFRKLFEEENDALRAFPLPMILQVSRCLPNIHFSLSRAII